MEIKNATERFLAHLHPSHLANTILTSILTPLFINCSEFILKENCLPSDSHTKTVVCIVLS